MDCLTDLYETAKQLRSFGYKGELRVATGAAYAKQVLVELERAHSVDPACFAPGGVVQIDFNSVGVVLMEIGLEH